MEPNARDYANYLTIGCRFVPHDQWLVTHLDTSWKISDVKRWLLAKCLPSLFTPIQSFPRPRSSQRRRPVSPITFASRDQVEQDGGETDSSEGQDYDSYGDDDEGDGDSSVFFTEKYKYTPGPAGMASTTSMIPTSTSVVPAQYMLLAFSTGQILEDHGYLSWYSLHPHEFLELHNYNHVVKLPREVIDEYVEPYFEAKVWALKAISGPEETEGTPKIAEKYGRASEVGDAERDRMKKRRTKLQWQERWIVIHQGFFRLCVERGDRYPPHISPLDSLVSLRGAEHLQHIRGPSSSVTFPLPPSQHGPPRTAPSPIVADKRIVCMKFRTDNHTSEGPGFWQGQWRRGSKDAGGIEGYRKGSAAGLEILGAEDEASCLHDDKGENTVLIVVDMLEDSAYNNILRVLHRGAPAISSSFFPASARMRSPRRRSYSPISFASGSSPIASSPQTPVSSPTRQEYPHSDEERNICRSVRFPEWRVEVMRRARRAGLGDVGRAMELAMFGSEDIEEGMEERSDIYPEIEYEHGVLAEDEADCEEERGRTKKAWGIELESDSGSSGDESVSEREWEGWEGDLFSQRARRRSSGSSMQAHNASFSFSSWGRGEIVSPNADYTFPPVDSPRSEHRDSLISPRQLSSYSSADSLLRRTIKRASPRKHPPLALRPSSPPARTRPMSPLAAQQGQFDKDSVPEPSLHQLQSLPHITYPSRPALDTIHSGDTRGSASAASRSTLPASMTMTSITSTVSVGASALSMRPSEKAKPKEPILKAKDKAKGKERAKIKQTPSEGVKPGGKFKTRKRSSTVQVGSLSHKPSSSAQSAEEERELRGRKSSDRLYSGSSAGEGSQKESSRGDSASERRLLRPGKLKLTMSFAQVTALGSGPSTARGLSAGPVSTSTSSFESPRFAHPDYSD